MKIFFSYLVILFCSSCLTVTPIFAQSLSNLALDTEPIESYLRLVRSIELTDKPDDALLKKYFSNRTVAFFNQRPGFDSVKFVNNLIAVYSKKHSPFTADNNEERLLMEKYKQHETAIRRTIPFLKSFDIQTAVSKRLQSFYSKKFNVDSVKVTYSYLFLKEGTGGMPGLVFNSALQTALLPKDVIEIISAHEAYHTITAAIFMEKFKHIFSSSTITQVEKNLLWYLEIVAEEGIADLIDKPVLLSKRTLLKEDYLPLTFQEPIRAQRKIHTLDSLLAADFITGGKEFDVSTLLENGGHIPGRFMGQQIYKKDFKKYVNHTGNPFQFFYAYNHAVEHNPLIARFSDKAIATLKRLEEKFNNQVFNRP